MRENGEYKVVMMKGGVGWKSQQWVGYKSLSPPQAIGVSQYRAWCSETVFPFGLLMIKLVESIIPRYYNLCCFNGSLVGWWRMPSTQHFSLDRNDMYMYG